MGSLADFNKAQSEGTTVGHEWSKQQQEAKLRSEFLVASAFCGVCGHHLATCPIDCTCSMCRSLLTPNDGETIPLPFPLRPLTAEDKEELESYFKETR